MMGSLAYITGRHCDPLRAGSRVNYIMGGMFGAISAIGRTGAACCNGQRPSGGNGAF